MTENFYRTLALLCEIADRIHAIRKRSGIGDPDEGHKIVTQWERRKRGLVKTRNGRWVQRKETP